MNQSFEPDPSHKAGHVRLSFKSHPGDRFETLNRLSPQLLNTKQALQKPDPLFIVISRFRRPRLPALPQRDLR